MSCNIYQIFQVSMVILLFIFMISQYKVTSISFLHTIKELVSLILLSTEYFLYYYLNFIKYMKTSWKLKFF